MKRSLSSLALTLGFLASIGSLQAQLPVGDKSADVAFAVFEGGDLVNRQLSDFEDQIVVFYHYAQW